MKDFWVLAMNDFWNRLPQTKNVSSCNYNFLPPLCKAIQNPPKSTKIHPKSIKSHQKPSKILQKPFKIHQTSSISFKFHPISIQNPSKIHQNPIEIQQATIQKSSDSHSKSIQKQSNSHLKSIQHPSNNHSKSIKQPFKIHQNHPKSIQNLSKSIQNPSKIHQNPSKLMQNNAKSMATAIFRSRAIAPYIFTNFLFSSGRPKNCNITFLGFYPRIVILHFFTPLTSKNVILQISAPPH